MSTYIVELLLNQFYLAFLLCELWVLAGLQRNCKVWLRFPKLELCSYDNFTHSTSIIITVLEVFRFSKSPAILHSLAVPLNLLLGRYTNDEHVMSCHNSYYKPDCIVCCLWSFSTAESTIYCKTLIKLKASDLLIGYNHYLPVSWMRVVH